MKTVIVGAVFATGVGIAGLAGAAPAMAQTGMNFSCAPCVDVPVTNPDGTTDIDPYPDLERVL